MNRRDHITVDPDIRRRRACIAGAPVLVATVLDNLGAGLAPDETIRSYPSLTCESVPAAVRYAAELARERVRSLTA